jgi:hypothetical protein
MYFKLIKKIMISWLTKIICNQSLISVGKTQDNEEQKGCVKGSL